MHSKHVVHRDIKPENFVLGPPPNTSVIYAIDFGLSKRVRDFQRRPETGKAFTGTPRYASINNHLGVGMLFPHGRVINILYFAVLIIIYSCVFMYEELGRNDDLESLGYMFVYFLRGRLPWSGLRGATDEEHRHKILEKKRSIPLEQLCETFPRMCSLKPCSIIHMQQLNLLLIYDTHDLSGSMKPLTMHSFGNYSEMCMFERDTLIQTLTGKNCRRQHHLSKALARQLLLLRNISHH